MKTLNLKLLVLCLRMVLKLCYEIDVNGYILGSLYFFVLVTYHNATCVCTYICMCI